MEYDTDDAVNLPAPVTTTEYVHVSTTQHAYPVNPNRRYNTNTPNNNYSNTNTTTPNNNTNTNTTNYNNNQTNNTRQPRNNKASYNNYTNNNTNQQQYQFYQPPQSHTNPYNDNTTAPIKSLYEAPVMAQPQAHKGRQQRQQRHNKQYDSSQPYDLTTVNPIGQQYNNTTSNSFKNQGYNSMNDGADSTTSGDVKGANYVYQDQEETPQLISSTTATDQTTSYHAQSNNHSTQRKDNTRSGRNTKDGHYQNKDSTNKTPYSDSSHPNNNYYQTKDGYYQAKDSYYPNKDSYYQAKDSYYQGKDSYYQGKDSYYQGKDIYYPGDSYYQGKDSYYQGYYGKDSYYQGRDAYQQAYNGKYDDYYKGRYGGGRNDLDQGKLQETKGGNQETKRGNQETKRGNQESKGGDHGVDQVYEDNIDFNYPKQDNQDDTTTMDQKDSYYQQDAYSQTTKDQKSQGKKTKKQQSAKQKKPKFQQDADQPALPPTQETTTTPVDNCILVENLSRNVSEMHIREIFNTWGNVINIKTQFQMGTSRLKSYIEYEKEESANNAAAQMDSGCIDGIVVSAKRVYDR